VERNNRKPFVEVVDELIAQATKNLCRKDLKASVADLIRAVDLEREMFPPKEVPVEVTWVDAWD
jgi:hypothetical protein